METEMVTLALCDDNSIQREIMEELLQEYSRTQTALSITVFENGRDLLNCVKENGFFDIYILDVVMPEINGMEIATTLRLMKDTGKIIFSTASLEYAVASYDVQAFYYMVKPVDPHKLTQILNNAIATLAPHDEIISVKTREGDVPLRFRDIMFVEVEDRTLLFHLADGRTCRSVALRGSFREAVEEMAGDRRFAPCGASKLLNLKYIDAIDSETVLFRDGTAIYPPRSAYAELRRAWREFRG